MLSDYLDNHSFSALITLTMNEIEVVDAAVKPQPNKARRPAVRDVTPRAQTRHDDEDEDAKERHQSGNSRIMCTASEKSQHRRPARIT